MIIIRKIDQTKGPPLETLRSSFSSSKNPSISLKTYRHNMALAAVFEANGPGNGAISR